MAHNRLTLPLVDDHAARARQISAPDGSLVHLHAEADADSDIFRHIIALDTEGFLKGSRLEVGSVTAQGYEASVREFRSILSAEIAKHWPKQRAKAQQLSDLLDAGNRLIIQRERCGDTDASTSKAVHSVKDAFWEMPKGIVANFLELHAKRGPGPASLLAKPPRGNKRRERSDTGFVKSAKRRQTEWLSAAARPRGRGIRLSPELQHQLSLFLDQVIEPPEAGSQWEDWDSTEGVPSRVLIQRAVQSMHGTQWADSLLSLPLDFSEICDELSQGSLTSLAGLLDGIIDACESAGVEAGFANSRLKEHLHAQAEALGDELAQAVKTLVEAFQKEGIVKGQWTTPALELPESIQANFEAYCQGEWRKRPYPVRAYERLQSYYFERDSEILDWKMSTSQTARCSGVPCLSQPTLGLYSLEKEAFLTDCECLAKNMECGKECGCWGKKCLNSRIRRRATLRLGTDIEEHDTWGMDCYTRRNIQDAVLESEVFGPYTRPDYQALISKRQAVVEAMAQGVASGETLQHSTKGSEAGIAQPAIGQQGDNELTDEKAEQSETKLRTTKWHESVLLPAIHRQGEHGWNLRTALELVQSENQGNDDGKAAQAVLTRLKQAGEAYFRVHPKGQGILCKIESGIPALTFVEEYFGAVYTPTRWMEIQDAVKKHIGTDILPDFYNIQLERPKDDPAGYDCLFIDAAFKGSFASRLSHSCTPNCQAIPMRAGNRLTIAIYTLRHINKGEELTFDYACVTESEREFRAAVCLCGTRACRGSFLYHAGSKAFMRVLASHQGMFARQMLILKASSEALDETDEKRLQAFGVRDCMLCWDKQGKKIPVWLQKWVSLALEFVELEQKLLPEQLVLGPPIPGIEPLTPETATSQAKGVSDNRLQNIAITLDKIKFCLSQPGQPWDEPLQFLSSTEIVQYLWTDCKSVAKRVLKCAAAGLSNAAIGKLIANADTLKTLTEALKQASGFPDLVKLGRSVMRRASGVKDAQKKLVQLADLMRELETGHEHSAVADVILMYAHTSHWFKACRDYKGFTSAPIHLTESDLQLKQTTPSKAKELAFSPHSLGQLPDMDSKIPETNGGIDEANGRPKMRRSDRNNSLHLATSQGLQLETAPPADMVKTDLDADHESGDGMEHVKDGPQLNGHKEHGGVCKRYGPWFIWGQLNNWYRQTISDPTASLSSERRGTISLPDIECAFVRPRSRYSTKEREYVLEQIQQHPDLPWKTNSMWSFKNEAKIYGSPMFDAAWSKVASTEDPMPQLIQALSKPYL